LLSGHKYVWEAVLFHKADATTTGAQFGFNIGAAPTVSRFGCRTGVTNGVADAAESMGVATARDTAASATDTSSVTDVMTILGGYIQPSANGTFSVRATSEVTVAAGLTIAVGSWLRVREVA